MVPIKLKHAESFYLRKLFNDVKVKEVMISPVITIPDDAPFHEVAEKFMKHRIRHLPVVDKDDKLIGIVSERDLYKIQSPRKLDDGTWYYEVDTLDQFILGKVMTPHPFTLSPESTLAEALIPMARKKYGCIPIVDKNDRPIGILTHIDLLKIADQIVSE